MKTIAQPEFLKRSSEFQAVYQNGFRVDGQLMTAFARRNETGACRFGITVSRRVSLKAVRRNRAKRLLREAIRARFRESNSREESGYDLVINAKKSLLDGDLACVFADLQNVLARLNKSHKADVSTRTASKR